MKHFFDICLLFGIIKYFVFGMVFVSWRILYLVFFWQMCSISIAVSLFTVVAS